MDTQTANYYQGNAARVAALYETSASSIGRHFAAAFSSGARVLDVGAGSGRDAAALQSAGHDAWAVEPVAELIDEAFRHHPQLVGRIVQGNLPALGQPFGGQFDGVVCSAVLMHVPEADLFDAAFALRSVLKSHGRLLLSLPLSRADVVDKRDSAGRLFESYPAHYLQLLFERLGFQLIGRWDDDDALQRAGTRWYTLLFELRNADGLRAVDQIEGILNRDRKEASYKLAMFRALAELAMQEPRCVTWRSDGRVGVPVRRLAEKWLTYYWPILAAPRFIPQSKAEAAGSAKQMKFRRAMRILMEPYCIQGPHGGLSAWHLDLSANRLSAASTKQLRQVLGLIEDAIIDGPVKHSGVSLASGPVFEYDKATAQVHLGADVWRELSLLGHWIVDAVVLRWAELTERIAHRTDIASGEVLALLLARPQPERATALAREIFARHAVTRCTWSDRRLVRGFVVDHMIPFSLWGCNDLWNLVPAHSQTNSEKSDKLPAADLLQSRRPAIVSGWRLLRDEAPEVFDRQAAHLLGRSPAGPLKWEDDLFSRLREAVEVTALQRGVDRWPRPPRLQ